MLFYREFIFYIAYSCQSGTIFRIPQRINITFSTRIYIIELCTLCTPSSALFVPSVTSDKDPPLLLSRYLPARIIGAPIAHVTPVGSGIHIMIKPTFCMCFPVFGERFSEDIPETLLPAVSAISLYMLARLLTEAE